MTTYYVWVLIISISGQSPSAHRGVTVIDNIASAAECQDAAKRVRDRLDFSDMRMQCLQVQKVSPK